jgi:hypothetical protein
MEMGEIEENLLVKAGDKRAVLVPKYNAAIKRKPTSIERMDSFQKIAHEFDVEYR